MSESGQVDGNDVRCPRCRAPRAADAFVCDSCGIVFATWQPRQKTAAPGGAGPEPGASGGRRRLGAIVAVAVVVSIAAGAWALFARGPDLGDALLVTLEDGRECRIAKWGFRYRRAFNVNRAQGTALVGPTQFETRDDAVLRVFDPSGKVIVVAPDAIREVRIDATPHEHDPQRRQVRALTIEVVGATYRFEAQAIPRLSRTRLVMPDAPYYFPGQFEGDHRLWGRASVGIVGTPSIGCETLDRIGLTTDQHPAKWTPVRIGFPAGR